MRDEVAPEDSEVFANESGERPSDHPANVVPVVHDGVDPLREAIDRAEAAERERDALRERVAELEGSARWLRKAIADAKDNAARLREELSRSRRRTGTGW